MAEQIELSAVVPMDLGGQRLDRVAAHCFPDYSRSRLQEWIRGGQLTVDQHQRKTKDKLVGGETLRVQVAVEDEERWDPEAMALDILYEDDSILVLNKPAGLVVHPGAGNPQGTLLNGLLHHCPDNASVPRAGIVHRLDKDTTGLMVVAKTLAAHTDLVEQLQARSVSREYEAVTMGVMTAGGTVDEPIGRHPTQRIRMAVNASGKPAITHYRVLQKYRHHTHVRVGLETGRTHQIRVHMSHIHFPLVGDPVYAGRLRLPAGATDELQRALQGFHRQALHACQLGLYHPTKDEYMEWQVPLPEDFQNLLSVLEQDQQAHDALDA
ncbi:23S rRNA pseudouridine(1911/1915/1917) synthase RluD [Aestuariirhabdus sp. Z084]|uniref:23S rRNA pseudouridine(1911/1915/1917) synthase RluD n=1 Tax=Aestuariirhabdus haliotis TaxID=2918751 RepID=UPI00201B3D87|nr:23S rRNA pseudouridine(1911/1915/1917) synthase RluD [Aestuariirhabdus haliotis]MCL6416172.1 23S rRNA pseudouridine(1911/1915/1917) synthase RluD [Aestuariirhabdus haliotis]MCL6420224.1 23S rRNA pseudouridine(1911/1915/1917) synthase RluD [Aestuariirhabdus haliotis]